MAPVAVVDSNRAPPVLRKTGVSKMLIQAASVVSPFAVVVLNEISALHDCNASEIRTYLALALHAGPDGDCWPGRRRLAEITGQTKANVSRSTSALAACGLIEKEFTPTGRVVYHLPLHRPCPAKAGNRCLLDTPPVSDPEPIEQTREPTKTREREPDPAPAPHPVAGPLSQEELRKAKTTAPDGVPERWTFEQEMEWRHAHYDVNAEIERFLRGLQ